jgi:hypothetical protein
VFTVEEVAEFFRTDSRTIEAELASERLAGFKVAGQWRVLGVAILDFLRTQMREEQQAALAHVVADPKAWAHELRRDPGFCELIEEQEFPPDTMGAFLKEALAQPAEGKGSGSLAASVGQGGKVKHRRFSERHRLAPDDPEITVRQDAPHDLRGLVVDFAYRCDLSPHNLRALVCEVLMRRPDDNNWSAFPNVDGEVRKLLDACEWYEVYDVIEAIFDDLHKETEDPFVARASDDRPDQRFANQINAFLVKWGVGYQLVDGRVEVRGPEAFEVAVRSASSQLEAGGLPTAAQEIHEALADLARRPKPDITGAIQHAMAAAECVARTATGDQKATFGDIIKQHPGLVPQPLDKALEKMWGYASEMARHIREGREPSYEEAELAVFTAAGVVTYLEKKLNGPAEP